MRLSLKRKLDQIECEIKILGELFEKDIRTPFSPMSDVEDFFKRSRTRSELLTTLNRLCQTEINESKQEYTELLETNRCKYYHIECKIEELHKELCELTENLPRKKILFLARMDCIVDNLISQYNLRREMLEIIVELID